MTEVLLLLFSLQGICWAPSYHRKSFKKRTIGGMALHPTVVSEVSSTDNKGTESPSMSLWGLLKKMHN